MTKIDLQTDRNASTAPWSIRRRIIFVALGYCLVAAVYAQLFQGVEMVGALLPTLGVLASAIVGSYVFGAVWDDKGGK